MFGYSLSWHIFAFILLESIIKTHLTVHDSSHGYIANNHKYFDEDISSIHEMSGLGVNGDISSMKFQLRFEPSYLDFKKRPLGVPHLEKVTLFNGDTNRSIDMTSISGSTVHFHSSFFEDKKIPPLGNTSFNVVFLGREEGFVESSLFIHTNEGHFKYDVKGSSVYSPYRLRPIVGVKLPVNASFSPLIYMHNPHTEAIQIVEVYSSGGEFHLELPSGELEGPKNMWEIPPLQTKAIIRVRFQGKTEQNHTAYVRIKLNNTDEVLVVPLEVEVTSSGGIFHPSGFLDFGIGGSLDPPKEMDLCVYNPLKKPVKIHSVSTSSKAVKVHYENVKLPAETKSDKSCISIGKLTVDWKTALEKKEYSGRIIVKYRNGRGQMEIPYYLTVLEGGLSFNKLLTRYFINEKPEGLSSRKFRVKNDFRMPVRLMNVSLVDDAQKYFSISNFKPLLLKPGHEADIFVINMKPGVKLSELKLNSHIFLKTNVSELTIPLLSYNGKLEIHLPFRTEEYQWDLGLFSFNAKKEIRFSLYNNNPVDVRMKSIKTSIPMTKVQILGCGKGNHTLALLQMSLNLTLCDTIKPSGYAIGLLTVKTSSSEGQIWGDIQLETFYENRSIPVILKVAPGKLEVGPDHLVFDHCFPGKICSHPLRIHSTYSDPMIIENIISLPPDPRISSEHSNHILARSSKIVGHLFLDPSLGCNSECYSGMQHDTTAQWLNTLSLWESVPEFDLNLANTFYNRYLNATSNGHRKWHNITLRLDTTEVKGQLFQSKVKMTWPSLLAEGNATNLSEFDFPLTQIGNTTYRNITLQNPSSFNLIVQVLLDKHYPRVETLFDGLPPDFLPLDIDKYRKLKHNFFLHESYREKYQQFEALLDLNALEQSIPLLLSPGEQYTFTVGFKGEDVGLHSALIFLRNNLTMIEVVRLKARGSYPVFKFGNRKPGSPLPLVFELTEKHLKDCEKEKQKNISPNLTVKRSFTARNTGDITVYVNNFLINGYPCEGYGFKVLNCSPFILYPNSTKKIDIAFTPDLTLSKIVRTLVLDTSLGFYVNYTLQTTLPHQYLSMCTNIITRPEWEIYLSYICTTLMCFILVLLLVVAFIDASRICNQTITMYSALSSSSTQPVLDLRLVGQQIRSEMRSKPETKTESTDGKNVSKIESTSSDCDGHDENMKTKSTISSDKSALIPITGRSKKKLVKKNSNEVNVHENHDNKKSNNSEPKIVANKQKAEEKMEDKKATVNVRRPLSSKKSVKSTVHVVPYEEETSSTTTESSSNNDEAEKENEQRNTKHCPKKTGNKISCSHEEASSKELSQTSMTAVSKPERRRLGQKNAQRNNRVETHDKNDQQHHKPSSENRKNHKNARERREKQAMNRKLSGDKSRNCDSKNCDNRTNTTARISPTISSNIWTENKASFSDVVARSDATGSSRPLSHPQTSKPTMYVEPYKQTTPQLGPIGSRREFWQDSENLGLTSSNEEHSSRLSNSFFSNAQDIPVESSQPFLEDLIGGDAWTPQQQTLMNFLEPNMCSTRQDTWNHVNNGMTVNSYWNNNFSLLGNNIPIHQPQQPQQHQQQQQQQQQSQSALNDQTGYLWGSSPVWAWAPPEVSRTPTRTPPGFDAVLQRNQEESAQHQRRETYNPFTTSNIWAQPETYPWDYSHQ